jgi:hypothetical protein
MPQGDPAGGGRHRPSPRAINVARTAEANPHIPDMRKDLAFNTSMASEVSIRPSSAGSFRPSASGSSPRHKSATDELKAKAKQLERLHDLYQTSFSRETLLSEQYGKELQHVREKLHEVLSSGQVSKGAITARDEGMRRTYARETARIDTMETKLSGLEAYNGQLIGAINNLRMQNAPNRRAFSKIATDKQKLAEGVVRHKQTTAKSLDERERLVDQLRHMRDDAADERARFLEQVGTEPPPPCRPRVSPPPRRRPPPSHHPPPDPACQPATTHPRTPPGAQLRFLKKDSDALDATSRQTMQGLEASTEQAKRQQYVGMRSARVHKEKLEVRYGYLRSQLEGIDRDFRELERIVGVRFVPSQPESLQQIINKFLEKEAKVASLQKFWGLQNEEIEKLDLETSRLTTAADAADAADAAAGTAAAEHAAVVEARRREEKAEQRAAAEALVRNFEGACKSVGGIVALAECEVDPALVTKGCSASTISGFLSSLDQKMDEVEVLCVTLRDLYVEQEKRERLLIQSEAENLPDDEDEELPDQRRPTAIVLQEFLARRSQALGPPQFAARGPEEGESPIDILRHSLPAVSDRDGHDEGDGEAQETRRSPTRRKGLVDREARDKQIVDFACRQRQIRENAKTARPSIRRYADEDPADNFQSFATLRAGGSFPSASVR